MSSPIRLIPRGDEDDNENNDDGVIENISTLNNNNNNNIDDANGPHQVEDGTSISLSSATSATSIASTLSDGTSRPRSASLSLLATPTSGAAATRPSSTPRQRSTPRSRPRSNPRIRTPMRRESPLLVTGRATIVGTANDGVQANNNEASTATTIVDGDENEGMVRNIFNTRRHRAGSIREEEEEVIVDTNVVSPAQDNIPTINENTQSNTATPTANSAPRAAGHWLAQAATNTTNSTRNNRSTNPSRSRSSFDNNGLSMKQRPSHRKLRRWNNDRFVGTSSEHIHVLLADGDRGDVTDQYWREFYMPHYPLEYRSEFAKLSTDKSKLGQSVRDRFVRGEVAHHYKGDHGKKEGELHWMERSMVTKFQKLGVSLPQTLDSVVQEDSNVHEMGKKLFQSLSPRIQSVVSRSCALGNDGFRLENKELVTTNGHPFASQVVAAFESYLVSLALAGSKKDVTSMGYPPQQPQDVYDLFDKVLSSPPKIVIRNKKHKSSHHSKHLHAVLVPTVHFYFSADDGAGSNGGKDNGRVTSSAFYRILLYAVCQFHGLESSSSMIAPNGKHRRRGCKNKQGGVKVVTVQGGVLLAPALKLLDYVE